MLYNTINKYVTRLLAVLLAAALVFAAAPLAFAMEGAAQTPAENTETAETAQEIPEAPEAPEETPAPAATSGSCGAGLSWSLSGGVLTITGSGAMTDYRNAESVPWYKFKSEISELKLNDGLTSVGSLAFKDCKKIKTVSIPKSVKKIGQYAFENCSGIEMLGLGAVETIDEGAFSGCISVASIKLPTTLKTIGLKAFYRCESIAGIIIPENVTYIGIAAFGYCINLVNADIRAKIHDIPPLLFYCCERLGYIKFPETANNVEESTFRGCDSLSTVYYGGSAKTPEEIRQIINDAVPGFDVDGNVSSENIGGTVILGTVEKADSGETIYESNSVSIGNDSTVSTKVTNTQNAETETFTSGANITITIENEHGWEEAKNALEEALEFFDRTVKDIESESDPTHITVYVKESEDVNKDFVGIILGRDITLTVMTADGSVWKINGMEMNEEEPSGVYDLSYTLTAGDAKLCEALGAQTSFVLMFNSPAAVNAEVLIRIGTIYARQNATLFQKDGGINRLQSVVVDSEGYAHFYLGSVSEKTEYYIAMNLPDAAGEAIIPQNMLAEYGYPEYTEPIKYEITGRESSWGMNLGQVMGILAAVMITVVIVVGVIMYIYNKRRLRNGYVPSFEDEE